MNGIGDPFGLSAHCKQALNNEEARTRELEQLRVIADVAHDYVEAIDGQWHHLAQERLVELRDLLALYR